MVIPPVVSAPASTRDASRPLRRVRAWSEGRAWVVAVAVVAIVALGALARFSGVNWDAGDHLNPDERYLSIVADNIAWPRSVDGYFDVDSSPLSPYNHEVGQSYVYGQLPLFATKAVADAIGWSSYGELNLVGRGLSAFLDTLSILLVFVVARSLVGAARGNGPPLVAAALYAFTVTAIQHAHFFTAESWLVFFTLAAFAAAVAAMRAQVEGRPRSAWLLLVAIGVGVGLAASSKLGGALVLVPVAVSLLAWWPLAWNRRVLGAAAVRTLSRVAVVLLVAYVAFRITSPYAFESSSWLNVRLAPEFREALDQQRQAVDGDFLFPPSYQWLLSTPLLDPLRNLVFWALGLPLGIAAFAGLAVIAVRAIRGVREVAGTFRVSPGTRLGERPTLVVGIMVLAFVLLVLFYFGSRFAHSIRYLLPIAPFLCVAAAVAVDAARRLGRGAQIATASILVAATGLYALAFVQIYRQPNTRVAASAWIAANVAPGSTLVNEHWDDPLPVGAPAAAYQGVQLPVFDPDDGDKLGKLYDGLSAGDYYILSSPRAWGAIGELPDRFPLMARFYDLLFAEELGFEKVADFEVRPGLLGVRLDDSGAEETFWVYDHPEVRIFRRSENLSEEEFRSRLCDPMPRPAACGPAA